MLHPMAYTLLHVVSQIAKAAAACMPAEARVSRPMLCCALQAYPKILSVVTEASNVLHQLCQQGPVDISKLSARLTAGGTTVNSLYEHDCLWNTQFGTARMANKLLMHACCMRSFFSCQAL